MIAMLAMLGTSPPAHTQSLADSYVEAQELGRRDEQDPLTLEYHRSVLLPQFTARYRAHLRDCQAALPQPDQTPFSFVAALDREGNVLRLWSDRSPPVYSCVRGRLLFDRFAPPPRAPFYLYVHMRFAT
jgi:hypothetical protein